MSSSMSSDEVRQWLRAEVEAAGGAAKWAEFRIVDGRRLDPIMVQEVLDGKRRLNAEIALALGLQFDPAD